MEERRREMKAEISVIMPLYNAKDYLKLAVDSVLNQTHKNIEIVIVDDCSTDGSLELCRELYGSDERVRIFKQEKNGGPGAARNRGISEARGEYIAFIDSDDEMMPDNLSRMFKAAKEHDADVLHNNHSRIVLPLDDGSMPLELLDYPDDTVVMQLDKGESITDIKVLPSDLTKRLEIWSKGSISWSVTNKMIRRSLISENAIAFPDMTLAEDAVFCLQCMLAAKNYVLMPGGWYLVRMNAASLTRKANAAKKVVNAIKSQLNVIKNLKAISEKMPVLKDEKNFNLAVKTLLTSIEEFSLRLSYQEAGHEELRKDENLSALFSDNFGANAPYAEFLFFQLHEVYPKLPGVLASPEDCVKIKQAIREARASGKEFVMKDE
jgi:glycosyltransferase involved in cell wall biosynthesis